jgi:hypothetical protein
MESHQERRTKAMARYAVCLLILLFNASMALPLDEPAAGKESSGKQVIEVKGGSADSFQVTVKIHPEQFHANKAEIQFFFHKSAPFKTDADLLDLIVHVKQTSGAFITGERVLPLDDILADGYVWTENLEITSISSPAAINLGPAGIDIFMRLSKSCPLKLSGLFMCQGPATPQTIIRIQEIPINILPQMEDGR